MSKHNIIAGIVTVLFLGAIIGLNVFSFLPATAWYAFNLNISPFSYEVDINRQGLFYHDKPYDWNDQSQSRDVMFISFGLILVSFVFSCICILITLVALFKRVHKKVRKSLFVMSILVFLANGLASLLFLRFNKALCNDLPSLPLPAGSTGPLNGSDICNKFKGSYADGILTWGPGIGWICSVVAFGISFFTIFLCSKILKTKKFGYHVIP
ncbi:hypothetical protein DICPUDRAFT_75579 [Dictyostelium purpureum]|uniref:Uncharacterized protein n=1 Tax=Dictyostelium purpureum TaxID=5786 RepID=F0ZB24_DICPU|nr:uncharacterized protein DICPUDRAFT_75579 [Dictyostelium purpureum]EGC38821.1 hypothetical protein DICPUDRAFT_75579 [Dictyostelium purpureum]|eukprot:XP_003284615.1 hypothetical protein DICPUDRAFT_75579 [Dictyostelium purpureum]